MYATRRKERPPSVDRYAPLRCARSCLARVDFEPGPLKSLAAARTILGFRGSTAMEGSLRSWEAGGAAGWSLLPRPLALEAPSDIAQIARRSVTHRERFMATLAR